MNMKGKIGLLVLAILAVSMLAVFPIPVRADPARFGYTYQIVQGPDFAWVGELAPGEWSGWVTVKVTIETGRGETINFPVYQNYSWFAEVTDNNGTTWYWAVEADPEPTYTWNNIAESVTVNIRVQVPENWMEECNHTFNVKLYQGYDSSENRKTIASGDGVHFKVCIKIPTTPPAEEPSPSISIVKSANVTMAHVGDGIKYIYEVSNAGNVPLSNVSVVDSLGITVSYVSGDENKDELLDTDETWIFEAEYIVPEGAPDELNNTATAYGTYGTTTVNATDSWTVTILKPAINVKKSGPEYAHEGEEITYTITVKNTGNCKLTDVTVIDDVLGVLTSYLPDTTLEPNEENNITVTHTVPQPSEDITNTVTAFGKDALDKEVTAHDSWTVDILHPAISVSKVANVSRAYAGDVIEYTIVVTNAGDCPLYNVNVTDTLLGDLLTNGFLDVNENKTFTVAYTVKAGDEDPLVNTVTVEGEDALGLAVSDYASAEVDLVAKICGYKFYDANMNGEWDEGEPGVEGIKIELWLGSLKIEEKTTGSDGSYCFDELNAGTYTIVEILPNNWMNTTSTSITVELKSGEISEGNNFGNVCLMPGYGGKTLGYWANAGNKLITSDDVAYLNSLNIYKPTGWNYPNFNEGNINTARSQIRNYLLSANAKDMRWMLSAQLITTALNVRHEYLNNETIVYVGPSTYVPSGFISISEIIERANAALAGTNRAEQAYWKNILDWLNNNKLYFVCPEPCEPYYP